MTPADTLFPTAPPTVCGAPSPAEVGVHTCERPPGHGGPHWVRGPRMTDTWRHHAWTVDWRDNNEETMA